MTDFYHFDRDPRAKTQPCRHCARDVEAGKSCLCVPAQPRNVPLTVYVPEGYDQAVARANRLTLGRPLRFLDEEPDC